jgi:MFS family permease
MLVMGLGFGMIFAPAINTATAGVRREDSGVASALVNTMQQVGGSIGTSALSTIALTATASYLAAHHTGALAPAIAATHGYTLAFTVLAALLGLGVILAVVLLPSRRRLAELRTAAAAPAPRAAARDARDPRGPVQLLAGDNPRFPIGGHAGPVAVGAGHVSQPVPPRPRSLRLAERARELHPASSCGWPQRRARQHPRTLPTLSNSFTSARQPCSARNPGGLLLPSFQ